MIYGIDEVEPYRQNILQLLRKHKEAEDDYNESLFLELYGVSDFSEIDFKFIETEKIGCYWPILSFISINKKEGLGNIIIDYLKTVNLNVFDGSQQIHLID